MTSSTPVCGAACTTGTRCLRVPTSAGGWLGMSWTATSGAPNRRFKAPAHRLDGDALADQAADQVAGQAHDGGDGHHSDPAPEGAPAGEHADGRSHQEQRYRP